MPAKPSYGKFAKDPLSARFLKFCKVATKRNSCKKKARKKILARMPSYPNYHFLEVPTSHNILLQTEAPKVPMKPSYEKFAKGTLSARFLKFCKVATRENSCKKKARKNTLARMISCLNYNFLKVPTSAQHFVANRDSQSAREAELCQICQGDPQRAFLKFCKVASRGNSCKKKAKKNTLARMPSCPH